MGNFKTVGILGGMGPAASAEFYSRVVSYAQQNSGAVQDTDFPPMLLYSLPLFGFSESGVVEKLPVLQQLLEAVRLLETAGADFIVIPCNSVHIFIDELRNSVAIPILSIVDEVALFVCREGITSVALIASESTLTSNLYDRALEKFSIVCTKPPLDAYSPISALVKGVMSGKVTTELKDAVQEIIHYFGGQKIILGCTELPLAFQPDDYNGYDSLSILAEATFRFAQD